MDLYAVVTLLLALRVLGPDVLHLIRRLLGAGVRIGAADLAARRPTRRPTQPPTAGLPAGEEIQA
ncbi:hypothetical protein EBN88_07325 [Streptomyces triticirhizae]|uniref:Uncharacterized protein n=1 Tax=Streptomyces triticirhizae TaxID=2483353 RepID=A0A3M2M180_9ACTN|nr:hypothetical protein EBN88_07325 [Streptomyces triticirhizae]